MNVRTILLVEDEVDLLSVLVAAVTHAWPEARVRSATTVPDALAILDDVSPADLALVLADYRVGPRTGLEVLERVRAQAPHTATVLLTGQAPPDAEDRAVALGVNVLWKPMNLGALLQNLRGLLPAA